MLFFFLGLCLWSSWNNHRRRLNVGGGGTGLDYVARLGGKWRGAEVTRRRRLHDAPDAPFVLTAAKDEEIVMEIARHRSAALWLVARRLFPFDCRPSGPYALETRFPPRRFQPGDADAAGVFSQRHLAFPPFFFFFLSGGFVSRSIEFAA